MANSQKLAKDIGDFPPTLPSPPSGGEGLGRELGRTDGVRGLAMT
jgi:hypothetical protein